MVASRAEAWIETEQSLQPLGILARVASRAEAWIEALMARFEA